MRRSTWSWETVKRKRRIRKVKTYEEEELVQVS